MYNIKFKMGMDNNFYTMNLNKMFLFMGR